MSIAPTAPARGARTPFARAMGAVSLGCGVVAAAMILAAVAITIQMIWVRFVMGQSTIWQTEAVTYLVIGSTLIGLPYVQRAGGHVSVDLLSGMLPPALRRGLAVVVLTASVALIGLMLWHAWEMFHVAWARGWRSESVWGPPLWIPYLAAPLGFGLYLLQLVADLLDTLAEGRR